MEPEHATNHDLWLSLDLWFVRRVDQLWILTIEGWENSRGVLIEQAEAEINNIPVRFVVWPKHERDWEGLKAISDDPRSL
jgi:hypothetical protein